MAQTKEVSELFLRYPTQNFADTLTAQTTSLAQINTATPIVIGSHGTSAIEFINRQMQKISGVLFEDGGEIFEQAAVNGNLFNSPSQTGAACVVFSVALSCIRNVFCREIMSISGFINKFLVSCWANS